MTYEDGETRILVTDSSWRCARWSAGPALPTGLLNEASGKSTAVLGSATMAPWSLNPVASHDVPLYPNYAATARILADMGTLPDFEADGSVRYTHRATDEGDIYFVANRTDQTVTTECHFRTERGVPERWDPVTGAVHAIPAFERDGGRTHISLQFFPHQSYFIVFRGGAKTSSVIAGGTGNFPVSEPLLMVKGPWRVAFDPAMGGPAADGVPGVDRLVSA